MSKSETNEHFIRQVLIIEDRVADSKRVRLDGGIVEHKVHKCAICDLHFVHSGGGDQRFRFRIYVGNVSEAERRARIRIHE